jgi:hypothetical protein
MHPKNTADEKSLDQAESLNEHLDERSEHCDRIGA